MIHVAVGILTNDDGAILIAQRPMHTYGGGLWEFPGGKVEPQENVYAALQREFQEEVGVQVTAATPWFATEHEYIERIVLLDVWIVNEYLGIPYGAEGQMIQWVKRDNLHHYQFPEGNRKIIEKLCS